MRKIALVVSVCLLSFTASAAWAQLMDQLKGAVGGGQGGGELGGMPSVTSAGPGNVAGVLQFCVKNNYLSGGSASSVSSSLLGKVSGKGTSDGGYQSGSKGLLDTGNGHSYSLGGGGIKEQITRKACDQVLQRGKSML
jgi:hypothetical protein